MVLCSHYNPVHRDRPRPVLPPQTNALCYSETSTQDTGCGIITEIMTAAQSIVTISTIMTTYNYSSHALPRHTHTLITVQPIHSNIQRY